MESSISSQQTVQPAVKYVGCFKNVYLGISSYQAYHECTVFEILPLSEKKVQDQIIW